MIVVNLKRYGGYILIIYQFYTNVYKRANYEKDMKELYSKVKPGTLLHIIHKDEEEVKGRRCLISPEQFLQLAVCDGLPKGHSFTGPHRHLPQQRSLDKTQEAWVIIRGSVEVAMYDLDDSLLEKDILRPGDCYTYLEGGHGFTLLEENTRFYEIKNGPYNGQSKDKEFIR